MHFPAANAALKRRSTVHAWNRAAIKRRSPIAIVPRSRGHYLNFKVVRAKSANTSDAIQKRTITLDSLQPISSKWW
jgi:hypothetical protein